MEQKTRYELHCDIGFGYHKLYDFPTIEQAEKHAQTLQSRHEQFFKIVCVTTTYTELKPFSVAAYIPDWEDVARDMASVYAQSIDWTNEDYMALSEEDRAKARELIEQSTDDCENCGWTFEEHYLSYTDHGRICDRCESDLEEEDESDEG
jgi:methionine synthase II (cobalamin-independent)